MAVELVIDPHAFVRFVVRLIVEGAEPLHFVILPLSVVEPSVLVVELTFSMAHPIQFVPLISAANFKMFLDVLRLSLHQTIINDFWSFGELRVEEIDLGFVSRLLFCRAVCLVSLIVNGESGLYMLIKRYRRRIIVRCCDVKRN
jgi:hypothetical protein